MSADWQTDADRIVALMTRAGTSPAELARCLTIDTHRLHQYCEGALPVPLPVTRYVQIALRLLDAGELFEPGGDRPPAGRGNLLAQIEARQRAAKRLTGARRLQS